MEGSTKEPERVDGGEESTPADARGGPRKERPQAEMKVRLGINEPTENSQTCMAWDGFERGGMQYIEERGTRRKEPRNLRDPKAKEGPGIK